MPGRFGYDHLYLPSPLAERSSRAMIEASAAHIARAAHGVKALTFASYSALAPVNPPWGYPPAWLNKLHHDDSYISGTTH